MWELFRTLNEKFKELDRLLVKRGNIFDDMVKEIRNINQRRAGLQLLQVQQPRLVVKADVLKYKEICESREDFAPGGKMGDISSDRVHDLMCLTSFDDQEYM